MRRQAALCPMANPKINIITPDTRAVISGEPSISIIYLLLAHSARSPLCFAGGSDFSGLPPVSSTSLNASGERGDTIARASGGLGTGSYSGTVSNPAAAQLLSREITPHTTYTRPL